MVQVSPEVARREYESWLESKRVSKSKRRELEDFGNLIVDSIEEGILAINGDTFEIQHNLIFPIESEEDTIKLTYRNRLNDKIKAPYLKGINIKDADARLNATIAALTTMPRGIIANLDSEDKHIASAIAVFF